MQEVRFETNGRVALVTGASSGIGRAIALALGDIGVRVGIAGRDPNRVAGTAAEIESHGGRACGVVADVSRSADVQRLVAEVRERLGPIDILVNSAGIYPRSTVVDMAESEWDQVLDTNLKSVYLTCHAVLPEMIARKYGRIVSVTSGVGTTGLARSSHYAASKAAINAFTRSLSKEVAEHGITVNAMAPGLTDTPMMRGSNTPEYIAMVAKMMPAGRVGQSDDPVGLVLFLCSEGARYITGQVMALRD